MLPIVVAVGIRTSDSLFYRICVTVGNAGPREPIPPGAPSVPEPLRDDNPVATALRTHALNIFDRANPDWTLTGSRALTMTAAAPSQEGNRNQSCRNGFL